MYFVCYVLPYSIKLVWKMELCFKLKTYLCTSITHISRCAEISWGPKLTFLLLPTPGSLETSSILTETEMFGVCITEATSPLLWGMCITGSPCCQGVYFYRRSLPLRCMYNRCPSPTASDVCVTEAWPSTSSEVCVKWKLICCGMCASLSSLLDTPKMNMWTLNYLSGEHF